MNDFIELRRVVTIVMRRWWLLVLLVVIGAGLGYLISRGQTPAYRASTTILVGESIQSASVDRVDIQISEALILTYVEIARRQPVLQGVVTTLNLDKSWQDLSKQVTVNQIPNTQIIEIVVEAESPELAQSIADEMVNQLILLSPSSTEAADTQLTTSFNREQITNLQERIVSGQQRLAEIETAIQNSSSEFELTALQQEKSSLESLLIEWERNYTQLLTLTEPKRDPTRLTVLEPAHSSNRRIRPRVNLNTLLGGGVGLVLALGLIFLLDFLDDTYRSLKDFSQSEELNILGTIRKIKGRRLSDKVVTHLQPHSPITESYRIIRSRLRFKRGDNLARSIMVTSSMPEEGKSLTAANLAVVFAQANFKTILVDANLRHPVLHEVFNVENEAGLGDLLGSQEMKVEECIKNTVVDNLRILTSGNPLLDPSGQLGSERIEEIIMDLKEMADIVIFDTPPVLVFADAIALSRRIDGVIMVIQSGKSKRSAVNQAFHDLQHANANLLGSIFNQSPKSDTFSVNKVYMQERPKLSFGRTVTKKETQFDDLRGLATPLAATRESPALGSGAASAPAAELPDAHDVVTESSENLELPPLEAERAGDDADRYLDLRDLAIPPSEDDEEGSSTNGFRGTDLNVLYDTEAEVSANHKKPAQLQDLTDSTPLISENQAISNVEGKTANMDESMNDASMPASHSEQVTIVEEESRLHDPSDAAVLVDVKLETTELNEAAEVGETKSSDLGDSTVPAGQDLEPAPADREVSGQGHTTDEGSRRRRRRKARYNGLRSEEESVPSPDASVEHSNE